MNGTISQEFITTLRSGCGDDRDRGEIFDEDDKEEPKVALENHRYRLTAPVNRYNLLHYLYSCMDVEGP